MDFDCQGCGACCTQDSNKRFRPQLQPGDLERMSPDTRRLYVFREIGVRADNGRCTALEGTVGSSVACVIYEERPKHCIDYEPGGDQCLKARARLGL